jgi:pseudouridine kinase
MGAKGVFAATAKESLWHGIFPGKMVNTTGCGDAFMGALVWAYLEGMNLEDTAKAGLAAGSIAMESNETINPLMCAELLKKRMNSKK